MKNSTFLKKLDRELENIFTIEPNDLENKQLTFLYKKITGPLKHLPLIYLIPMSLVGALVMYILFDALVIKLVSILQYGF